MHTTKNLISPAETSIKYGCDRIRNAFLLDIIMLMSSVKMSYAINDQDRSFKKGIVKSYIGFAKEQYNLGDVSDWEALELYVKYLNKKIQLNWKDKPIFSIEDISIGVMAYQFIRMDRVDKSIFMDGCQVLLDYLKYRTEVNWTSNLYLNSTVKLVENLPEKHIFNKCYISIIEKCLVYLSGLDIENIDIQTAIKGGRYINIGQKYLGHGRNTIK